jgi:TolA-binding protein
MDLGTYMKTFSLLLQQTNICFKIIFIGIALSQLVMPQLLIGQTKPPTGSNDSKQSHFNDLLEQIKKVDYATQCARNAVTAFADSAFLPELLFQLSEWEIQREKLYFDLAMMKYDHQLQLFENGKLKQEPTEPILTFEKALNINQQIIDKYPEVPFLNKVLYRTGICLFETGKKDSSKQIFLKLVTEYPDSIYIDDILFRLGECYFDEGNYEEAIQAYQQILESWQSPFFAMALYKIAWCHYRINNYSDAISTFYYLLNDIKFMENLNSELLGKSQFQLKEEIMEYITLSFSDFGGTSKLFGFIESTGGSDYTPYLLHKLGKVYIKRDFYEDAIDALNLLLNKYPHYEKLPEIFSLFFECYEKSGDMNKAYTLHDQIIAYCGPKSKWSQSHKNQKDLKLFDSLLTEIDYKIATPLLNAADSLFATQNYNQAAAKYSYFLKIYREDERNNHVHYCLAECYYNMSEYKKAADAYKSFLFNFPENELQEDAGYNYIVCYDQILKQSNTAWQDSNISIAENEDLKNLIKACYNFLKWLPKSRKEPEIKLKLAEIFYQKNMYPMAEKYARSALISIIKYNRGNEHKINGLNLLAQISFKQGKFRNTEVLASLLIKEKPDSSELVDRSNKMLASTSFKIGEEYKGKGENRLAALKFEQTAMKTSDPQIAEASLFESAIQFEEAKQFNRAAINFENFYKKYPHSEHAKEAIYRAALLRDKLEQYHLGAKDYVLLHELTPDTLEGSAALYNAALAYEKAKDWFSMAETFKKYLAKYPNDNENILEARFKVGHSYELKNMKQQANIEYQTLLDKYNQLKAAGEFADDYFAAQATFRLAELKRDHFKSIKLTPPLQVNLKKKQNEFNRLLKSYVDVAKFNIADWTTAAFYRLGLAYEEFCQDILESPAPPNLKGDDLNAYWKSINQQWIVPLQKEALKYYQTNEKLAIENNLTNEWIDKTRARILFLNKKLATESSVISTNDQVKETSTTVNSKSSQERKKL